MTSKIELKHPDGIKSNMANTGLRWTKDETQELLDEIQRSFTVEEIAQRHSRTPRGIKAKLCNITFQLHNEGNTVAEIAHSTSLPLVEVKDIIRRRGEHH